MRRDNMFAHQETPRRHPTISSRVSPLTPRSFNVPTIFTDMTSNQDFCKIFSTPLSPPMTPLCRDRHPRRVSSSSQRFSAIVSPQWPSASGTQVKTRTPLENRYRPSGARRLSAGADSSPSKTFDEVQRKARREDYLKRVRKGREARTWEMRSEQILHRDFLTQQRHREEELARSAPVIEGEDFDVYDVQQCRVKPQQSYPHASDCEIHKSCESPDEVGARYSQQSSQRPIWDFSQYQLQHPEGVAEDEDEIQAFIAAEERELDALVSLHESSNSWQQPIDTTDAWNNMDAKTPSSPYGSQDDNFDELLLEVVNDDITENDYTDAMDETNG